MAAVKEGESQVAGTALLAPSVVADVLRLASDVSVMLNERLLTILRGAQEQLSLIEQLDGTAARLAGGRLGDSFRAAVDLREMLTSEAETLIGRLSKGAAAAEGLGEAAVPSATEPSPPLAAPSDAAVGDGGGVGAAEVPVGPVAEAPVASEARMDPLKMQELAQEGGVSWVPRGVAR